ncbi:hypothetical protein [Streptomyces sp. NPDC057052]|uniref:hypothetical protein n=1 Tax=Streptomyces sp. NPDC057052 TaxID=3346010 RepID=UPI0036287281
MSSGISHRKDVEFLEDCNPPLVERNTDEVERNADEFKRLHDMLVSVDPSAERAEKHTQWKSEGGQHYEVRLTEGRKLIAQLAEGYDKASGALRGHASRWRSPRPTTPTARPTGRPSRN